MAKIVNPQQDSAPAENPISKPDATESLGRFTSLEAKRRSLANLRAPFAKGQAPPHGVGRPKKDGPATRELRGLLTKKFPNDPQGRSYLKLMIEGLVKSAIKGNVLAANLIMERLEGRTPLPVESDMPCLITVVVNRNQQRYPEIDQQRLMLEANTSSEKAND